MNRVVLYDIDSKIPNLALMKISSFYKKMGYEVILSRQIKYIKGSRYFASSVFHTPESLEKVAAPRDMYGDHIEIGGSPYIMIVVTAPSPRADRSFRLSINCLIVSTLLQLK